MKASHPMGDSPRTQGTKHNLGTASYYMKEKICATCGQGTRKSYHNNCKRVNGKLLVVSK